MTSPADPSNDRADRCLSEDDGDDSPLRSITGTAGSAATAAAAMGAVAASANAAAADAITIRRDFIMAFLTDIALYSNADELFVWNYE